ncbi:MAG: amidohydrolase family protein [Nitrospira sp.]
MITLIEHGEVYSPTPLRWASVLAINGTIVSVGAVDRGVLEGLGLPMTVIDASACYVTPGFIDPHEHLIGGSGERGFQSQTPPIALTELLEAGITTVVGCLGVDHSTKTMGALLAHAKGLREAGISAFMYSGGYAVPPATLTDSLRTDLLYITEVIGAGEIAVADLRSSQPAINSLATLVAEAYVGGLLSGKAGVTHFHVGDGRFRLRALRQLLEEHDILPACLYPTHVERHEGLMKEAVDLTKFGVTVDVDTVEEDLSKWLQFYRHHDGDPTCLTVSSDAAISSPKTLLHQIQACVRHHGFALEEILPLVTTNTARVLKLGRKGSLQPGYDADLLIFRKDTLDLRDVVLGGKHVLQDGRAIVSEEWRRGSNRR